MTSKATTVQEYLDELEPDRLEAISALRKVINENLPEGYEEGMQYGMIGWYVPHSVYPPGYHCDPKQPLPYVSVASQKNHIGVYAFCVYGDEEVKDWFVEEFKKTGKKLDMGKSCIRFKKLDGIPLELIGEMVAKVPVEQFVANYEASINTSGRK